jgi:Cys-tRNA(Pro)/Cys-tRNA(Cys) deacylase
MVKTLIFQVDTGEKVLVMLPGDKNAISGHLKKALGSRNIRLADPATVKATTGYDIGSIPPFHWHPPGFRVFMDASLVPEDLLGVGAGVWGQEIMLTPLHLVQAAHAVVVNLTNPAPPVVAEE